jgi:fatty-acyl-CoA synthase
LINADKAIGELVNTHGGGFFSGCYNDPNATYERMRGGMFRSGGLGYKDSDGLIYPAGRTTDWMRNDAELSPAEFEQSSPRNPTCPRRRGHAGWGSAATCRSPRRTRYSSAN